MDSSWTIPLQSTQPILKYVIRHHQRKRRKKTASKKRGRKPKAEREQWLKEQAEKEANLPIYEKKIEAQLTVDLSELRDEVPRNPQNPQWGVKKNSEGKNVYWYGYKGHLAVGTSSQYVLQSLFFIRKFK